MKKWFKSIENSQNGSTFPMEKVLEELTFDDNGLIPVIAQDAESNEILMFAWMNADALRKTLESGAMTYWSRSRGQLWTKGESSGHVQNLVSMSTDCDGDVILAKVTQSGGACHTNRRSCFYIQFGEDDATISE